MGMMTNEIKNQEQKPQTPPANTQDKGREDSQSPIEKDPVERGGPKGPEPTRFGDWESGGRCTDF